MGVSLTTHVVRRRVDISGLTSGARFLLLLYCEYANNNTHLAYPGTPTLVMLTGLAERQVQRYVQELRDKGFLRIHENRGGRRQYAVYQVCIGLEPPMTPTAAAALEQYRGGGPPVSS